MSEGSVPFAKVMEIIDEYVDGVRSELDVRWAAWKIDLTKTHVYEVIGGLVAREVTLATQLAQAPPVWNGHVAPLFLRAMTDAYVTLAWIFEDPESRSDQYVKYGLGQRKLWIEHLKASLVESGEENVDEHPVVKRALEYLNAERFEHLTEVSVGSWSEMPTRKMAEESGCLDLYNLAYVPFSAAVHSMWYHVASYNLVRCDSPLHQHHRIPLDPELEPEFDFVYRAAKYVRKTFVLFDEKTGVSVDLPSSFERLVAAMSTLGGEAPSKSPED